jgi:ABC-2 type transport system ATP-binding protein
LVSSHILAELDEYSTHMLALNQGRVLEHRALGQANSASAGAGGVGDRLLRLEFVRHPESVASWLASQPNVTLRRIDASALEISLRGDASAQAALVKACVAAGHPLTVIAPVTENLQQSYLKSLEAERTLSGERIQSLPAKAAP